MINNQESLQGRRIEEKQQLKKDNSTKMEFGDSIDSQHEQLKIITTNEGEKSGYLSNRTILNLSSKAKIFFKTCVFVIAIGFLFMGKSMGVPDKSYPIIHDPVMYDVLDGMNNSINSNRDEARAFQISSSLCMDLSFFAMYIYWILNINTGRLLYATAAFYVLRGIVQKFVTFPFPDGYFWDDPGFPSLTVPYGHTSDFFWSGHCGFLMLLACEWFVQKKYYMCVLTCLIDLYMGTVMIGFRIHYTVDVIIGVFMAHYCYLLFSKAAPYIDEFVKRIFNKVWSLADSSRNNNSSNPSSPKQEGKPSNPELLCHENKL